MHGKGCNHFWPHNPLLVREFLNEQSHEARDADAIRTHPYWDVLPVFILCGKAQIHRFLLAEIENVAHLGGVDLFKIAPPYAEAVERLVGEHFLVYRYARSAVDVCNVFSCFACGLEFVTEFGERAARGKGKECIIPNADACKDL